MRAISERYIKYSVCLLPSAERNRVFGNNVVMHLTATTRDKKNVCIIYSFEIYVLVRFPRTHNDVKDTNGIVFLDKPCIDTQIIHIYIQEEICVREK